MPREIMDVAGAWASAGKQLFGGQAAYEDGKTRMAKALAEQAKLTADTELARSHAGLYGAQADEIKRRAQFQSPEFAGKMAGAFAGLTDPQTAQMTAYQATGKWGDDLPAIELPANQDGPVLPSRPAPTPDFATPQTMQRFNLGRAVHLMGLGATDKTNAEQMAHALERLLGQGRIDDAIANPSTIPTFGRVMAANEGKPLFHQGANGVMDQFTGAETLNEVGKSAAQENRAQAGAAAASARAHDADASLKRSKIGQGQTVTMPDGTVITTAPRVKMSATEQKETFEADDLVSAGENAAAMLREALTLNNKAYSGYGAKTRAVLASNLPGQWGGADETINLDNLMTGQALESLKATFGAAPTEGERKILMDMQASADKTPEQRKAILERAIALAERRTEVNRAKAKALRDGSYLSSGYAPPERKAQPQKSGGASGDWGDPAPPKIQRGQVMDGYRFKGGNPANPADWEPVK